MSKMTDKQKRILKHILSGVVIIVLVAAWAFIVKEGVTIGKLYIDDAIGNVEMRNIEHQQRLVEQNSELNLEIKALNNEITVLRSELNGLNEQIGVFSTDVESLKSSIEFIDTTIDSSIMIQAEIANKLTTLESRIAELKSSLNVLLEAPQ